MLFCVFGALSKLLSPPDRGPSSQPIGERGGGDLRGFSLFKQISVFLFRVVLGVSPHFATHSSVSQQLLPTSSLVAWQCQLAVLRVYDTCTSAVQFVPSRTYCCCTVRGDKVCKCNSLKAPVHACVRLGPLAYYCRSRSLVCTKCLGSFKTYKCWHNHVYSTGKRFHLNKYFKSKTTL